MYQNRTYRNCVTGSGLASFSVTVKETDLLIHADRPMEKIARESILKHRGHIESHIELHPEFATALVPLDVIDSAPAIINEMTEAGKKAGVGPMAAVAGVIAQYVGLDLLAETDEVIVENGGDLFFKTDSSVTIGIFAGASPLSMRMGLKVNSAGKPVSICTSSGTVGHSLSMGMADAVSVIADSCALADAAATSICNRVKSGADIRNAIEYGKTIDGVSGIFIVAGENMGMWGDLEVVPLRPLKNVPFRPTSALVSNFNPRNT